MSVEEERLSAVVASIYDATLDSTRWSQALEGVGAFVSGCAAMVFSEDTNTKTGNHYYSWGDDPAYTQLYFEKYARMSPFMLGRHLLEVGEIRTIYDLVPRADVIETKFFQEWMKPQDYLDNIFSNIEKSATCSAAFAIVRNSSQGLFDVESRRKMQLIVPHMRRAILISNVIDFRRTETTAFAETLSSLAAGVFFLDARCQVIFANRAGQSLIKDGSVLRQVQDVLSAVDPIATRRLQEVCAASKRGDQAVGISGVAIKLPAINKDSWIAHVLPLTSGDRQQAGVAQRAVAAIFVQRATLDFVSPWKTLAEVYRLSLSELRVLHAAAEIGGISAMADFLGISEATVKTHLQHLFEKTGTKRQVDLVKLVAAHASPFSP